MKKSLIRTLYAVLCIAFMFTFMEGVALADESGEWGNLTWKLDSKGTLTISGTGEMEELSGSTYHDYPWQKKSKINSKSCYRTWRDKCRGECI